MSWTKPVTDRTLADVLSRTEKAFFNVADWLRIYGNSEHVNTLVNKLLGLAIPFTTLTPPAITHFPTADEINALIANIDRLRQAAALPESSGVVPLKTDWQPGNGAAAPDYEDANDWERDLALVRALLITAVEQVIYCGTFNCGQPRMLQVGFRRWGGYVPEAYDPVRRVRMGSRAGTGLTRQNRWRSPVDRRRRVLRCGVGRVGEGATRQNGYRRYA